MKIASLCCCLALALLSACTDSDFADTTVEAAPITAVNYRLFRGDGTKASWQELIAATKATTVTFLGEWHNDPVAHHLERSILRDTLAPGLALSLEMFETDVQHVLDEYLAGQITEEHLISAARAWDDYASAYRPLIELARQQHLPVIAANPPRRYVNIVSRLGSQALESLSGQAKRHLPPLPYAAASPAYAEKFFRVMEDNRKNTESSVQANTVPSTPAEDEAKLQRSLQAQSLWDAGMAHSIASFLERNPDGRVLHVNGSFHSAQHLGIPEHLARYRPSTSMLVITLVPDPLFPSFDRDKLSGLGDFVIVTDPALQPESAE